MSIEITDVAVFPVKGTAQGSKLRAYAKVTIDNSLVLAGMRIVEGNKGLFLGFPQNYIKEENKGYDYYFPITAEFRDTLTRSVLGKYKEITGDVNQETGEIPVDSFMNRVEDDGGI
jgi:stage V sporulation protein G